jgi:hypothetical protein
MNSRSGRFGQALDFILTFIGVIVLEFTFASFLTTSTIILEVLARKQRQALLQVSVLGVLIVVRALHFGRGSNRQQQVCGLARASLPRLLCARHGLDHNEVIHIAHAIVHMTNYLVLVSARSLVL